jgi:hypothetical protein
MRDVAAAAHEFKGEVSRVDALAVDLASAYRDLFTFAGQVGASREGVYLRRIEERKALLEPMRPEAAKFAIEMASLTNSSNEDLTRAHARISGFRAAAYTVREEFEREWASVQDSIRTHRERAVRNG